MMSLAITACSSSSDCFREEVFCAALVTDTLGIEDHGINQDAWAGLLDAKENHLADRVEYIESVDARDYEKNIAYFVNLGFDLILTSGISLADATLRTADLYPDSSFAGLSQPFEESRPNLAPLTFPEDQMGFAAGVLATQLTQTKIVAAVCETSGIGSMWRYCEGFRAGVKYADESVTAIVTYRENGDREKLFIDETWGYDTGAELINRGADVIFAAGGVTGQGALRAASEYGVYAIGAERDQAAELGESGSDVVTSFYGDARFEVQEMTRRMREGEKARAGVGAIKFANLPAQIPPSAISGLEALLTMLKTGQIQANIPPEKP